MHLKTNIFLILNHWEALMSNKLFFFDETHRPCQIGNVVTGVGKSQVYQFKRNKNKKLDPNGTYNNVDPSIVKCKHDKEIRLLLGVASLKYADGRVEGKRTPMFSYTEKTIVANKEYLRRLNDEIQRVKNIPDEEKRGWVQSLREKR